MQIALGIDIGGTNVKLERLKTDTLTEEDAAVDRYSSTHPLFTKIITHILEKNHRELRAFQNEAEQIDLDNRLLLYASEYLEDRMKTILGPSFIPRSVKGLNVLAALSNPSLPTPSMGYQHFKAGELAIDLGKAELDRQRLTSDFRWKIIKTSEDKKEFTAKIKAVNRLIEKLRKRLRDHLTAFNDNDDVKRAINYHFEWGLSGECRPGARIPDEVRVEARAILWQNLRHIGPRVVNERTAYQSLLDEKARNFLENADEIADFFDLISNGIVSLKSREEIQTLFIDRFFEVIEELLTAAEKSKNLFQTFFYMISINHEHSHHDNNPIQKLRRENPRIFFKMMMPLLYKIAEGCDTLINFESLMKILDEPDSIKYTDQSQKKKLYDIAARRLNLLAVSDSQIISTHTAEDSFQGIIKPKYGAMTPVHQGGGMANVSLTLDDLEKIPNNISIYQLGGRFLDYKIGTKAEAEKKGLAPRSDYNGLTDWYVKIPASAADIRSFLPHLDSLAKLIANPKKRTLHKGLRDSFSTMALTLYRTLSQLTWFTLTEKEWHLLLAIRYGKNLITTKPQQINKAEISQLMQKLQLHAGFNEVFYAHTFLSWAHSKGISSQDTFRLAADHHKLLRTSKIVYYANNPSEDYDEKFTMAVNLLNWLAIHSYDLSIKSKFFGLLNFIDRSFTDNTSEYDFEGKRQIPFFTHYLCRELKQLKLLHGIEASFQLICINLLSLGSLRPETILFTLLNIVQDQNPDDRALLLVILLNKLEEKISDSLSSSSFYDKLADEVKYIWSRSMTLETRTSVFTACLNLLNADPRNNIKGSVFDRYFEELWESNSDAIVAKALMNPEIVGKLSYFSNKEKLAKWQLEQRFGLKNINHDLSSGKTITPHHTAIRPIIFGIQDLIDKQFPNKSTVKDAVINWAEDQIMSTAAENENLRSSRIDLSNWHKATELSLVDVPAGINYLIQTNFDRLELIKYLIGRHPHIPRCLEGSRDSEFERLKRTFVESNPYARAAFLQSFLDEHEGIFSDDDAIAELEELILGDYNQEPTFRAIYLAYLNRAPKEEIKVLLATLLSTFVDAPPGTSGASLKDIINSMGPFGWKAGQFMRSSGIVGKKLADELDGLFDRAAPPSRKMVIDDLRQLFGDDLAPVYSIRELKGSGSIAYVVIVDLISPSGEIKRVAVHIKRHNVEGLVYNENEIWENAVADLKSNPDIQIQRYASIVDEARRHSMATLQAGGDELDLSNGTAKYNKANNAYSAERGQFSGRRLYAARPIPWAASYIPEEFKSDFAIYEYIDFVPLKSLPLNDRIPLVTDIILAELAAIRERDDFDPDGHRGNWLVASNGEDLVRIDYIQLRHVPFVERQAFLTVFKQLIMMKNFISEQAVMALANKLPNLFESLPANLPISDILETALRQDDYPTLPHERLLYIRDKLSDYIQDNYGDPAFLLLFTDGARSMLTSISKISGYRNYVPDRVVDMAIAKGLGLL